MTNNEFHSKLQQAKQRVDAWPDWKKKHTYIESSKSINKIPREPVNKTPPAVSASVTSKGSS